MEVRIFSRAHLGRMFLDNPDVVWVDFCVILEYVYQQHALGGKAMSEKIDPNESIESLAVALMIVGIVQGVCYFFAEGTLRLAVIYCESWVLIALAVVFSILAKRKVEVKTSVFVVVVFFVSGLGGFYTVYSS